MTKVMYSTKKESRKNLIKRICFTIFVLLVYNALSYVIIPGIDPRQLAKVANNPSLMMMSLFSGGGFQNLSLMSMGVSPYITAQIIVQLFSSGAIKILTEWSNEGKIGRQKLTTLTRWISLVLGFVQAIGIVAGINALAQYGFAVQNTWLNYIVIGMLLTAGSFIGMWLGDQITQNALGNGISVIIAAGIIKRIPDITKTFILSVSTTIGVKWDIVLPILLCAIIMMAVIIWFNRSEYRVPVQYTRRGTEKTDDSYLPLKLIVPGVIPVIFAASILTIPQTVLLFFQTRNTSPIYKMFNDFFSLTSPTGITLYAILIVLFTYVYSVVQVDPIKLADNLSRQDAYIPSIWPGDPTAIYMKELIYKLDLPGSMFLMIISVIPLIASNTISPSLQMGLSGSSLLIIVGTLTDIGRQIEGLKLKEGYSHFLSTKHSF